MTYVRRPNDTLSYRTRCTLRLIASVTTIAAIGWFGGQLVFTFLSMIAGVSGAAR